MKKLTDERQINRNLSDFIDKKNIPVGKTAEAAGMDRTLLSKIRTGKASLDLRKLKNICEIIDIYPSELLPRDWIAPENATKQADIAEAIAKAIQTYKEMTEEGLIITDAHIIEFAKIISFLIGKDKGEIDQEKIKFGLQLSDLYKD